MVLINQINKRALENGRVCAFSIGQKQISYAQMRQNSSKLYGRIISIPALKRDELLDGVERLVVNALGNNLYFPAAFLAATAGTNCCAVVDPNWAKPTFEKIIKKLRPDVVLLAKNQHELQQFCRKSNYIYFVVDEVCEEVRDVDLTSVTMNENHPFLIVFSSGTTALPKAIVRTRKSWQVSLDLGRDVFHLVSDLKTIAPGPLAHGLALYALVETLDSGGSFLSMNKFDAAELVKELNCSDNIRLVLVPTMLRRLCEAAFGLEILNVATITIAGAKLSKADFEAARLVFPNAEIIEYYGASEIGFMSVSHVKNSDDLSHVGSPFGSVELSILDEEGARLASGETGLVAVKSPLVALGYLWEGSESFLLNDGYASVGDCGYLDENGHLWLVGRVDDMINSGGYNIFPTEINDVLCGFDFIDEACVFAIDHKDLSSVPIAVISIREGHKLDIEKLAEKINLELPRYKQPRHIWKIEKLPYTSSGKIAVGILQALLKSNGQELEQLY